MNVLLFKKIIEKDGEINMRKKYFAFTIVEIILALVVIAVITTLTISSLKQTNNAKAKRLKAQSQAFYSTVQMAYSQMVTNDTSNGSIETLKDVNNDKEVNSSDLQEYFIKYADGEKEDCKIKSTDTDFQTKYLSKNVKCFSTSGGIIAAVELDTTCSINAQAKEYLTENDNSTRIVNNVCARVVYAPYETKGILGSDLFLITFGKRMIK